MLDWIAIASTCGLALIVGVGLVLWERYEVERLARERLLRRVPRRGRAVSVRSDRRVA
jgi:hypothetical protein